MSTIQLSRNIFVPVKECGSVIINVADGLKIVPASKRGDNPALEWNLCFYTCLMHHLLDKMTPHFWRKLSLKYSAELSPSQILLKFKEYLTASLPFANIFTGDEDPQRCGAACDHRVIQKAANVFKTTIYILQGGNKIYRFVPEYTESTSMMCLFFHKFHYRIIEDETYKEKMKVLYDNPEMINELYKPHIKYNKRAYSTAIKRGSRK